MSAARNSGVYRFNRDPRVEGVEKYLSPRLLEKLTPRALRVIPHDSEPIMPLDLMRRQLEQSLSPAENNWYNRWQALSRQNLVELAGLVSLPESKGNDLTTFWVLRRRSANGQYPTAVLLKCQPGGIYDHRQRVSSRFVVLDESQPVQYLGSGKPNAPGLYADLDGMGNIRLACTSDATALDVICPPEPGPSMVERAKQQMLQAGRWLGDIALQQVARLTNRGQE